MHNRYSAFALAAFTALAACGGGSGAAGSGAYVPAPQPQPSSSSPPQSTGNMPLQETVAGAAALVNPANHRTLYFVDGDTPAGAACSGGCTSVWPVFTPAAGSQAQGNFAIVTRSDNTMQWSFNGHALYEYSGDSGPDQANGVYGPWHIARP